MKGIYLIAIAFLASWTVITAYDKIPTRCPDVDPINTTIHLRHETDCTKFYMCLAGEKIEKQCPFMDKEHRKRLHFNARKQVCDLPNRAGCRKGNFVQDQSEAANEQPIWQEKSDKTLIMDEIPTECPAEDPKNTTIQLPFKGDCTKYYMCLGGEKILLECPIMNEKGDRLHFNPRKMICDWPKDAGCKKNFVQDQAEATNEHSTWLAENEETLTMADIPTRCPDVDPVDTTIHLRHETDCTKFYMCLAGEKIEKQCPFMDKEHRRRLHFNARKQVCDWPNIAGCKNGNRPGDDCDGKRYVPHECNCGMFYECTGGYKILRECSDDMYFSTKWQGCVKYEDSECTKKKPPVKCTDYAERVPHECDCTKYYKCDRELRKILLRCDRGLHFSPKYRKCMKPNEAGCDRNPVEPIEPDDCPKPYPDFPWRHECDCRLFYKCENGKKRLHECTWGFYFNVKTGRCDYLKNVHDCKNNWDKFFGIV